MEKKELKFYEAPAVESIELELEGHLLDASIVQPKWTREVDDLDDGEE